MSFFSELRRRKVPSAALSYAVVGWLLLQVAAILLPTFEAPDWVLKVFTLALLLGFPIAVVISWFFQFTPQGLKKEDLPATPAVAGNSDASARTAKVSLAVLPFANLSNDPENEYFSDGLSEEILNTLVSIPELHVPARTSCFHFKGHTGDIETIGRELRVKTLLEGSVRKVKNLVRIAVQLIDVESGFNLWSQTFNRELDDMLKVQDEIAATVAAKLKVKLLGRSGAKVSENGDAYNAYLRGRFFWNKRTHAGYLQAIDAYREALALEPQLTAAHAGIADASTALAIEGDDRGWYEHARKAAATVLELDSNNVDGHICQARLLMYCDWDWEETQQHLERAVQLNPSSPSAQAMHARFLTFVGRLAPALEAQREALRLDPMALIHNRLLGALLYCAGRYDEAARILRKTIELDPAFLSSHFNLGCIHLAQGEPTAALAAFEREPHIPLSLTGRSIALHAGGQTDAAQTTLDMLIVEHGQAWGYQVAQVYAQRGDVEHAFEWLDRALLERDAGMLSIGVDPLIQPLTTDPRFRQLLTQIGVAAYYDETN